MEVEEAVKIALQAVQKLFSGGAGYRLEEVELRGNDDFEVTVSFIDPQSSSHLPYIIGSGLGGLSRRAAIGVDASRTYKDVVVDQSGKVKSVKMRQIVVG